MKRLTALALACSLLCLTGSSALAKDDKAGARPGGDHMAVCKADLEKYCKNVKPGDGRLVVCMQSNVDRLSSECQTMVKEKMAHEKAMREKRMDKKKEAAGTK